jgi:hypothetical protein
MKLYPSIPRCDFPPNRLVHVFTKYDGSNLRWEWSRKKGWYKFGTRHRLFDKSDPVFGKAIPLFQDGIGPNIVQRMLLAFPKLEGMTVFTEYFGPHSFAGHHDPADRMDLILFDVNVHKYGFMTPDDFVKLFHNVNYGANYRGKIHVDQEWLDNAREGRYSGPYTEGFVLKWYDSKNKQVERLKVKTKGWLDKLKASYGEAWEQYA